MIHHLYRYIEDGKIIGGPKALPTNWRDKGDISGWSAQALKAEGWLPNMVDDQRVQGEESAGWTDTLEADRVVQVLKSQPAAPADPEQVRQQAIDQSIANDSRVAQLKAMTNAQLSTWWSGLTTAQRNDVLFLIVKVVLRRVL